MKQEKALELVLRYSTLTKEIKRLTTAIGESLSRCQGVSGKRLLMEDGFLLHPSELDSKNREKDIHLWGWYQPDTVDDGFMSPMLVWDKPVAEIHGIECPHCFAAHQSVQLRKEAKRKLGHVKRAISRATS